MNTKNIQRGFTLIELLVVVLIIGILAAVAVPQYQKTVAKSQAAQALTLLQSLQQAYKAYYMANGEWATSLDNLDITIPWTGNTPWKNNFGPAHSTTDWSAQLTFFTKAPVLFIGRLTGPYAGTGFAYFFDEWGDLSTGGHASANTLTCVENRKGTDQIRFPQTVGSFCKKIMGSSKTIQTGDYITYFDMP